MADIYDRGQALTRRLLRPGSQGGMGQGSVVLTRTIKGEVDPEQPWVIPVDTTESETIRAAVRGVSKELVGKGVGETVIVESDRQAITELPKGTYTAGDVLSIDGKPVHILSVTNIPAAGTVCAVRFLIRG